jgi:outer membrane protein assembly factor BamB
MQASRIAVTFVAACFVVGGQGQAQPVGMERSLPSRQLLARHGLELVWWGQGVLNTSRDTVQHLSSDEDCVYVQSTSGIVTAFDMLTGQRRWAVKLGRFDHPSFRAVSNEDVVLIVVGTSMYGLDKVSGRTLWELRIPGPPSTSPAVDDKQVYIGMLDGSVYAFDLRKIHSLFRDGRLPDWSFQALSWRFQTSQEITSPPLVFGTRLLLASRDGNVYAITTDNRDLVFQFETDGAIVAPLSRANEVLFVASEDFSFYALRVKPRLEEPKNKKSAGAGVLGEHVAPFRDRESGRVLWEFTSGRPIRTAPMPIGSDVFLMPDRGGFYALSAQTGTERWWQPQGSRFVAAASQKVYVSDREDNLLILSRANGSILGSLALRQFPLRFSNDRTDRIIASTQSGLVVCLREKGRSIPIFHMFPERLPLLPEFATEDGEASAEEGSRQEGEAGTEN